ncbi:Sn1-specific diacylglycerol lipase alpha [Ananas comosus]|uniref:Sn1-specific diacylglycerol lipase alpha n=1 Tax=Ananas comosus TaxID=4615 RepID=A0A199UCZ0_ANACO|nr:Sn1-specific diacylglycerol lipase alpha [Ananas comosus]
MGAAAMASAARRSVLMYLVLSGRLSPPDSAAAKEEDDLEAGSRRKEDDEKRRERKNKKMGPGRWPERSPTTLGEAAAVAARTVRFTYAETLGKWPLGELAFGIKYYMKQQGNLQHEYTGSNCIQLKGNGIRSELISLLRYLNLCMYFSKKPFQVFLEFGRYGQDNVLIQKSKARLLKPAFTVIRDRSCRSFILFIRGAISVKDRLTAATGAEVPFHHVVLHEGSVRKVVLGYAHCGMVAAARWIAKRAIPCLRKAVLQYSDYKIKIIGHSMGAGIAAILTYILREYEEFSSCTCIAFAPGMCLLTSEHYVTFLLLCVAACMTWDLAESGKEFITTLINRTDLVPTFSKVTAENLRSEVMASPWVNDLRDQIQQTRFLKIVNQSVTFFRSHLPFISGPRAKVMDADIPEAVLGNAADTAPVTIHTSLLCLSCLCPRQQAILSKASQRSTKSAYIEQVSCKTLTVDKEKLHVSSSRSSEEITKGKLRNLLEEELRGLVGEAYATKELAGKDETAVDKQFYPPGKIMHMVALPLLQGDTADEIIGIYRTPRELYGKIRLARTMIREHYMPQYKKMLELLIDELGKDDEGCASL